ncbi:hypothetical protein ACFZAR_37830 [Streptomyces sp. NPDC008222]|uniref:hypothetical protein n=1 Tax=Streptomyces sp. NPDC008222 TaxID=3364820 RepID=UPI0036EC2DB7
MQRDDEPTILASIAAASARVQAAEEKKRDADAAARQAKDARDRERRILADRVVAASRNDVPQKLIAQEAQRTREWVRTTNLGAVNPDEVTAIAFGPHNGGGDKWRAAALYVWMDSARMKGLEPLVIDTFEPKGNEIAQVLVYDLPWTLLLDGETVRVALGSKHYPDPAFDPNYQHHNDKEA